MNAEAFDAFMQRSDIAQKVKDKLLDRAKEKKALVHWKNIKELREIMDGLKKMINGLLNVKPRKYLMHLKI